MSVFTDWVRKKEFREGLADGDDPSAAFKFNTGDDDLGEDYERTQNELFQLILRKYPDEAMNFLNGIAQRGDEEVAALLRKVTQGDGPRLSSEPRHPSDNDEIVPFSADTGYNSEGGDE